MRYKHVGLMMSFGLYIVHLFQLALLTGIPCLCYTTGNLKFVECFYVCQVYSLRHSANKFFTECYPKNTRQIRWFAERQTKNTQQIEAYRVS